jgi:hypothetical protein
MIINELYRDRWVKIECDTDPISVYHVWYRGRDIRRWCDLGEIESIIIDVIEGDGPEWDKVEGRRV